jgi:hypothetical protein
MGFGGLGMTKKVVTSDELERLMLAKIKEYSDWLRPRRSMSGKAVSATAVRGASLR